MNDTMTLLADLKLRFNINHPNLEECYVHGYESGQAEITEGENPFPANSPEHEHWQDGWWAGFYGEQPLYDLTTLDAHDTDEKAEHAANDGHFFNKVFMTNLLKIAGAIAASAIVGYQLLELVA